MGEATRFTDAATLMTTLELGSVEAPEESDKRFGTFLGVFLPSLLTILGVIMYQRLGKVVGQAGLTGTIAIVCLAHVISVTTGLSVSSIATNHTVRTGGNYYIVSRSLGLSIGGAIGIALYVALALGVSLYLLGFAEVIVRELGPWLPSILQFADPLDSYRAIGSIACAAIAVLTLFSTSLALKSQLFVLAAIVLSLLSILWGGFGEVELSAVPLSPPPDRVPGFGATFALFFPAVTGFTAGVGMSGDLKNPKRAIPVGTIGAIVVGFLIYLALPFLIAHHAPADVLLRDQENRILSEIAQWPQLVTAGVCAATLSSALGSILGAPRTLKALALDGVVPRFLARGKSEPRIALMVTVVIAEAGILIGSLDQVSKLISMFFLTCYGFLCLACGLERWASSDFRPQFKVPVLVSLSGAFACFLVMFFVDPAWMTIALLVMFGLYAVLKRRQLRLGAGDTWSGVWSAVVRMGLMRLRATSAEGDTRNWRPNLVVMTRETGPSELLEFAWQLVRDRGLLTHFSLVEGGKKRAVQNKALESDYPGIFARVQGCDDVFSAIPMVVANFGLVGIEANTTLLGWPQDARFNRRYAEVLSSLIELDVSVLMLRVDPSRGFGERKRIDIWWDGVASTGPLMWTLAHFLVTGGDWKGAKIRVLVNRRGGAESEGAGQRLRKLLADARVVAEPVMLPPLADAHTYPDRIRRESADADLVMIHAEETPGNLEHFVPENDRLISSVGTVLLVRPASEFAGQASVFEEEARAEAVRPSSLTLPQAARFADLAAPLLKTCEQIEAKTNDPDAALGGNDEKIFIRELVRRIDDVAVLERRLRRRSGRRDEVLGLVDWARARFSESVGQLLHRSFAGAEDFDASSEAWLRGQRQEGTRASGRLADVVAEFPERLEIRTKPDDWAPSDEDGLWRRAKKIRVRAWARVAGRYPTRSLPVRSLARRSVIQGFGADWAMVMNALVERRLRVYAGARRVVADANRYFENLHRELRQTDGDAAAVAAVLESSRSERQSVEQSALDLEAWFHEVSAQPAELVHTSLSVRVSDFVEGLEAVARSGRWPKTLATDTALEDGRSSEQLEDWRAEVDAAAAALRLDLEVSAFVVETRRALMKFMRRTLGEVRTGPLASIEQALELMEKLLEDTGLAVQAEEADAAVSDEGAGATVAAEGAQGVEDEEPVDDDAARKQAFLEASDALRRTWAGPLRVDVREALEPFLVGLGRAAERLPEQVLTRGDAAEGETAAIAHFPTRRLLQSWLEAVVARPVREIVRDVPAQVGEAQNALVDSVRLVAFELEQYATGSEDDQAEEEGAALSSLREALAARKRALVGARQVLLGFLDATETRLEKEILARLPGARQVASSKGSTVALGRQTKGMRRLPRRAMAQLARSWSWVEARVEAGPWRLRSRAKASTPELTERIVLLRESLALNPEVQAGLPLVYRRLFGRSALEASDLVVGRDAELGRIRRQIERWNAGDSGPIILVGPPRSGRTTLLSVVSRELEADRHTVRVVPPVGGSAEAETLNAAIVKAVGGREGQGAEGALRALPPGALVLADNLEQWLERSHDGLGALSLWARLWQRLGDRHLFVASMSSHAWHYANAIGDMRESFAQAVFLPGLDNKDLRELIMLRQRTAGIALDFARAGLGIRRREIQNFGRLALRSAGNVGDALDIWRRSIVAVSERRVLISVRDEPDTSALYALPLRWNAALVAVVVHRAVTVARMARIMGLSREDATRLLSDMERAKLLAPERGSAYGLDSVLQPFLLRMLKERGFLP